MTATELPPVRHGFRHEAFIYSGENEFIHGLTGFVREGVARNNAVLVVVDAPKIDRLRTALAGMASSVSFADMQDVGHNPALIMQVWRDFVIAQAETGRALRGVGEPMSSLRSEAARTECHIHETLLNGVFESEPDFWLLCPYDSAVLAGSDVATVVANHPYLRDELARYVPDAHPRRAVEPLTAELGAPPSYAESIPFGSGTIGSLRKTVARRARVSGVGDAGVAGLELAVSEVATNTVVHGHGHGRARVWVAGDAFLCDLHGPGRITDPMVGRLRPQRGQLHGYGIWLANQFCDLVQIRSGETGTTVRLHLTRDARFSDAR